LFQRQKSGIVVAMAAAKALSTRQQRSQTALLDAAVQLFLTYGFRHTSMERVAEEAGVSRGTAYARFPDKQALFSAVVTHLADYMITRAEAAAHAAKSPREAVLASLSSKQTDMYVMVHQGRHATELLDATANVSGVAYNAAHARYQGHLAKWVARCKGVGAKTAPRLAVLLDQSAEGLCKHAPNAAALHDSLELLVTRVLADS
jgi:AcrR family transcriptional regulator